ncbi:MAG: hypothetical protein OXC66_15540, partial [Roseovarius sp.]|nr:hypothetical protein [Roseovarius sp.]
LPLAPLMALVEKENHTKRKNCQQALDKKSSARLNKNGTNASRLFRGINASDRHIRHLNHQRANSPYQILY